MQLDGKLSLPGRLNAVVPGKLVHACCQLTGRRFLLDTGASYSLWPHRSSSPSSGPRISGPSGSVIPCWGDRPFTVRFQGRTFKWNFLLAHVSFPIIGIDFLQHFGLFVHPSSGRLIDIGARAGSGQPGSIAACPASGTTGGPTVLPVPSTGTTGGSSGPIPSCAASGCTGGPTVLPVPSTGTTGGSSGPQRGSGCIAVIRAASDPVRRLLVQYQAVVNSSGSLPSVTHDVQHHLVTSGPPVSAKFRRLDGEKLKAAREEFRTLEAAGIVRRSSSQWASPLHMVRKSDGSWRPCGDYRRLNLATEVDRYPLPNIQDFAGRLYGSCVFSKLDLKKGYYQIPMLPEDIRKTAVTTPFGLWEFTRMPFGLKNAGMTFQRLIDRTISGLDFVFGYLDDLLIFSPDEATHLVHLRQVLERLRQFGLVLNAGKCLFAQPSVEYLGHVVSSDGAQPLPVNVEAILSRPRPSTIKDLQGYLGMINFYRRFIPRAAAILLPLTNALRGDRKGSEAITWSPEMSSAFSAASSALSGVVTLAHPEPSSEWSLAVDASATHVGAALQQRSRPTAAWRPLGFFSRKLSPTQVKYSAFDRELLACYEAIRHFRHLLEGRHFHLLTDHKPLTFALSRVSDPWTPRQGRQLAYVAEFTSDIRHIAGTDNVVADALSRPPVGHCRSSPRSSVDESVKVPSGSQVVSGGEFVAAVPAFSSPAVDYVSVAANQKSCPSVARALESPSLQVQLLTLNGVDLYCDTSDGRLRPLIPEADRYSVFRAIHEVSHPGIRATTRLVSSRFVWCGLATQVRGWCLDCTSCQTAKVTRQPVAPVQSIPVPEKRFSHIHVDLVGPLPASASGHTHLLTVVDRSTRWVEAIPVTSTTATSVADHLVNTWISRFGVPSTITSDRGRQFTSQVWADLCSSLNITHRQTTAYHPQSNGMVERVHRRLKEALKARQAGQRWLEHLPWVLFGLRTAPREDTGTSAAELVYGSQLALPGQLPETSPSSSASSAPAPPPTARTWAQVAAGPPAQLSSAAMVYVRRGAVAGPLAPPYSGPFRVLRRGQKSFDVAIGDRTETISVDRLKPHLGSTPTAPAEPPVRGRPRASPLQTSSDSP